jgi:hypothetical protein
MGRAIMLKIRKNEEALPGERMKTIPDYDLRRRNPGIMSPLQIAAAAAMTPYIRCGSETRFALIASISAPNCCRPRSGS